MFTRGLAQRNIFHYRTMERYNLFNLPIHGRVHKPFEIAKQFTMTHAPGVVCVAMAGEDLWVAPSRMVFIATRERQEIASITYDRDKKAWIGRAKHMPASPKFKHAAPYVQRKDLVALLWELKPYLRGMSDKEWAVHCTYQRIIAWGWSYSRPSVAPVDACQFAAAMTEREAHTEQLIVAMAKVMKDVHEAAAASATIEMWKDFDRRMHGG